MKILPLTNLCGALYPFPFALAQGDAAVCSIAKTWRSRSTTTSGKTPAWTSGGCPTSWKMLASSTMAVPTLTRCGRWRPSSSRLPGVRTPGLYERLIHD
jgi:hypothetical protein